MLILGRKLGQSILIQNGEQSIELMVHRVINSTFASATLILLIASEPAPLCGRRVALAADARAQIAPGIWIQFTDLHVERLGLHVKLGFDAPRHVAIWRKERLAALSL